MLIYENDSAQVARKRSRDSTFSTRGFQRHDCCLCLACRLLMFLFALQCSLDLHTVHGSEWAQRGSDINGEAVGDESGVGTALSSNGTILAIGAFRNDGGGAASGHVRVYRWSGSTWNQMGSDINGPLSNSFLGITVDMSSDGTVLATGGAAYNSYHGLARVYVWSGSAWIQRGGDLTGEAVGDEFGIAVSLSSDGTVLAVSGRYNDGSSGTDRGHVRVFAWSGSSWGQRGSDIDGEAAGDWSGNRVSLSADGSVLAVGAPYNDGGGSNSGHVRVYEWGGSSWSQLGSDIDGEAAEDQFGLSVSLSSDGTVLAAGARFNDDGGSSSGHVRVFKWNGSSWVQRGSDLAGIGASNSFGFSVDLSSDGDTLAAGGYGYSSNSGYVRAYKWTGSAWSQAGNTLYSERAEDFWGVFVSLSEDGSILAVGATGNDDGGSNSGHTRVFTYIGDPTSQPSSQPSRQPTRQPTSKPTNQPTGSPSTQPSSQPSRRPSSQPSNQPSSQPSTQPSRHPSSQPSTQPTRQPVGSPSGQPSSQPSQQPLGEPSGQPSSQPSLQPICQPSSQPTGQPSTYPTSYPSSQPSAHPTRRPSSQPTAQPVGAPSSRPTSQPSRQPTVQPSTLPTVQPTALPSSQPSLQPSSHPTYQPSTQPSGAPTLQPSMLPSSQPSSRPSPRPSMQPSRQPSTRPSSRPSAQPVSYPSVQPVSEPSAQPSSRPSVRPSSLPSAQPTGTPSGQPSCRPSAPPSKQPVSSPTRRPSNQPSGQPTSLPSYQPTVQPSSQPSTVPTSGPSTQPSNNPTYQPVGVPSVQPSSQPSSRPSRQPSCQPSHSPSGQPTCHPSQQPSCQPSSNPTSRPSRLPTSSPSSLPTSSPSTVPSSQPIAAPTSAPSMQPSGQPTCDPSSNPSSQPTSYPSATPSRQPTSQPTTTPSSQPTAFPSCQPSAHPTAKPTLQPTSEPSSRPTISTPLPTYIPTPMPTRRPSRRPSAAPSQLPTPAPTFTPSLSFMPSLESALLSPSKTPSRRPSFGPTVAPSALPTVDLLWLSEDVVVFILPVGENDTAVAAPTIEIPTVENSQTATSLDLSVPVGEGVESVKVTAEIVQYDSLPWNQNETDATVSMPVLESNVLSIAVEIGGANVSSFRPSFAANMSHLVGVSRSSDDYDDEAVYFRHNCSQGSWEQVLFSCPGNITQFNMTCFGSADVSVVRVCPVLRRSCNVLSLSTFAVTDSSYCEVTFTTRMYTICTCGEALHRVLQSSGVSSKDVGDGVDDSVNDDGEGGGDSDVASSAVSVAVMSEYVVSDVSSTLVSSSMSLSGDNVAKDSSTIVVALGLLWSMGLLLGIIGRPWSKSTPLLGQVILGKKRPKSISASIMPYDRDAAHSSSDLITEFQSSSVKSADVCQYFEMILPTMFSTKYSMQSISTRLMLELYRRHSWLRVVHLFRRGVGSRVHNSIHTPYQQLCLQMVEILTMITLSWFVLAMLFDLQFPSDDGTCGLWASSDTCSSRTSLLDSSQTYCTWSRYRGRRSSLVVGRMVERSVVNAVSRIISSDDIVLPPESDRYLCQYNDFSPSLISTVIVTIVTSIIAGVIMSPISMVILACGSVSEPESRGSSRVVVGKRAWWCHVRDAFVQSAGRTMSVVVPVAQDFRWRSMVNIQYRRQLPPDDDQHISSSTKLLASDSNLVAQLFRDFRQHDSVNAETTGFRQSWDVALGRSKAANRNNVFDEQPLNSATSLIHHVDTVCKLSSQDFNSSGYVPHLRDTVRGMVVLQQFICDLLGSTRRSAESRLFEHTLESDPSRQVLWVLPLWMRITAVAVLVLMNVFVVYYTLLRGLQQGPAWQMTFVLACVAQTLSDVFFFQIMDVVCIHVMLPSLIYADVREAIDVLRKVASSHLLELRAHGSLCNKPPLSSCGDLLSPGTNMGSLARAYASLDSTMYFFASSRLAREHWPGLWESAVVASYHSIWPVGLVRGALRLDRWWSEMGEEVRIEGADGEAVRGWRKAVLGVVMSMPMWLLLLIVRSLEPFLLTAILLLWLFVQSMGGVATAVFVVIVCLCVGGVMLRSQAGSQHVAVSDDNNEVLADVAEREMESDSAEPSEKPSVGAVVESSSESDSSDDLNWSLSSASSCSVDSSDHSTDASDTMQPAE